MQIQKKIMHAIVPYSCVFLILFSEKYLQEVWPHVKSALKEHGIDGELNLVSVCS